ncbi:MAG: NADP oxidoreductase [Betaproteobacteria bacterium]|nr:NADP oxidoreductase [Betaproteobacteria bacterium]
MSNIASTLRAAVVGSGPSGFYSAEALFRLTEFPFEVDVFDRLPVPYGLVRYGVAPDHQNIKAVIKTYEKTAANPKFAFFGNVELGRDVTLDDLRARYDLVFLATGCAADRHLGIAGEDLAGNYAATEFVAWYNGHPDYRDRSFPIEHSRAVVVGVGNVAMDVTRILLKNRDELAKSDIDEHALAALRATAVSEVVLLGRRGAAQAAFAPKEIKEIGDLADVDLAVDPADAAASEAELAAADVDAKKNVEYLLARAAAGPGTRPKRARLKMLASPVEVLGNNGRVAGVRIERNRLIEKNGQFAAVGTGVFETIECGAVFRSIGYHGIAIPSVPFDAKLGRIPNHNGRVLAASGGQVLQGVYCAGWIKRGPTGLVGTNKPDAQESVRMAAEDLAAGAVTTGGKPSRDDIRAWLQAKGIRATNFADWKKLDALEQERGRAAGKVRRKLVGTDEMLKALG